MKKTLATTIVAVLVRSVFLLGAQPNSVAATDHTILAFNTLVGVPLSFTGTLNPIRGITGGGLPWKLT